MTEKAEILRYPLGKINTMAVFNSQNGRQLQKSQMAEWCWESRDRETPQAVYGTYVAVWELSIEPETVFSVNCSKLLSNFGGANRNFVQQFFPKTF